MKKLLSVLLCMLISASLYAQQINIKKGEEFAILTRNTETIIEKKALVKDDAYTFQFKMLSSDASGCKLQCTLLKIKEWGPDKIDLLDIDSIRKTVFNRASLLAPLMLLQKPFTVTLNKNGKLLKMEGVNELITLAKINWHLSPEIERELKIGLDQFLAAMMDSMFFTLPDEKIAFQSTWTNPETKTTYKVNTIRGALLDINTVTTDKNSFGNFTLNETNGLLENASTGYSQASAPGARKYTYDHTIKYGVNTAPSADTAWINMAVLLSFWSDAFTSKNREPDSVRITAYFNAHDVQFATDPYYINAKLGFLNHLDSEEGYKMYNAMLVKTPNKIIVESSSNTFNKLQAVSNTDVEATYDLIKTYNNNDKLYDWIQNSYGQHFLHKDHPIADQLMERLLADKQLGMQSILVPMSLWVDAKSNNADALTNAYNKFMKMDDVYMKKGNGGRYALLTYQMLEKSTMHKEAGNLLDKTIHNLERYSSDTLNKEKFAHRNLLAYAYYLKYKSAALTDTAKALQYLAKASLYSPGNKSEKAHISFYDRALLKSKESYRDEFIDKLFAFGNADEALKIFADQITADPQRIDDMQKIYQKRFPDKSFKEFFIDKVVSRWADAPAFELTDLSGKKQPLADYKGQWLVMDFWGTWCGPCREEMPEVNKFNTEVAEGKYKGVNFLGVACFDTESKVRAYLKDNNYGMRVAMSDNIIEKNYKISGYPSKILIAPNGKMIDIVFKADWQLIIKKFNELYAAN